MKRLGYWKEDNKKEKMNEHLHVLFIVNVIILPHIYTQTVNFQHNPIITITFKMHNNIIISWHSGAITQVNDGVSCAPFKFNCHN